MARAGRALMLERFQLSATADGIAAVYDRHFTPASGAGSTDGERPSLLRLGTRS